MEIQKLSISRRKNYAMLRRSRERREQGLFLLEGTRMVNDAARYLDVEAVIATNGWYEQYGTPQGVEAGRCFQATSKEIEMLSSVATSQGVVAVCRIPDSEPLSVMQPQPDELVIALDGVQDPGNLGTIMRVADWFGVRQIVASTDTVDLYNPKVLQATMGSFVRVKVAYGDLREYLERCRKSGIEVMGTFLEGESLYEATMPRSGVVVMGNEGNGISPEIERCVSKKLTIPSFPPGETTVESLNVAMATGMVLAELRRPFLT